MVKKNFLNLFLILSIGAVPLHASKDLPTVENPAEQNSDMRAMLRWQEINEVSHTWGCLERSAWLSASNTSASRGAAELQSQYRLQLWTIRGQLVTIPALLFYLLLRSLTMNNQ